MANGVTDLLREFAEKKAEKVVAEAITEGVMGNASQAEVNTKRRAIRDAIIEALRD